MMKMSQKIVQKKTINTPVAKPKTNAPKATSSQVKIVKKPDDKVEPKVGPKQSSTANKIVRKPVNTVNNKVNENKIKTKNTITTNDVKKKTEINAKTANTLKPTLKAVNNVSKTTTKSNVKTNSSSSKATGQKSNTIIKNTNLKLDHKIQKTEKIVTKLNDNITKDLNEKHLKVEENEENQFNKDSSDEQYISLATLDTNSSFKQSRAKYSESVLAEPPSVCDTDIDDYINNTTDNQSNDDIPSDYFDDFEEYESDFEDEDEDQEEEEEEEEEQNDEEPDEEELDYEEEEGEDKNNETVENLDESEAKKSIEFINNSEFKTKLNEDQVKHKITNLNHRIESKDETPLNTILNSVKSVKIRSESEVKRNISLNRSKELLEIIKLNKISFTNFNLPPINYELFIKTFGRRDAKQVSIQTTDREDSETQTDSINTINKWTQNPSFTRMVSGNEQQLNESKIFDIDLTQKVNPFLLSKFLNKAEAIMSAIIDSEFSNKNNKRTLPKDAEQFSTSLNVFKCLPLAKKCSISYTFTNSLYLFCVQNVSKSLGSAEKSVISVWNLLSRTEPEKVLICRSHISTAFSDQNLVVGAMIDGSVALWDLNEQSYCHKQMIIEKDRFWLRTPSYNSAIVTKAHNCPIVSISELSFSESNDNCVHFITIDEIGVLIIWTINEAKEESNDLGLSYLTNYKMSQISVLDCLKKLNLDTNTVKITAFECRPNDWSNFYCGTDNGLVLRCTRYEELVNQLPKVYNKSQMNSIWTKVSAINFNKSENSNFLVGFTDGFVGYYSITNENPLIVFNSNDLPIINIKWISNETNSSFIALNQSNQIFIWDLKSEQSFKPIVEYKHLNNRLLSMSLWKGNKTYLVFGCDCGQTLVFNFDIKLIEK